MISPLPQPPPPAVLTPPYPVRERPTSSKKETSKKSDKLGPRKQAEAEEFPWHRQLLDWGKAKEDATWDMNIYDPDVLASMAAVRVGNKLIIDRKDSELLERQRETFLPLTLFTMLKC